jgi:hypothetical protein
MQAIYATAFLACVLGIPQCADGEIINPLLYGSAMLEANKFRLKLAKR